jgi:hypothetical protein
VYSGERRPTFRGNIPPPSSVLKSTPRKKPERRRQQTSVDCHRTTRRYITEDRTLRQGILPSPPDAGWFWGPLRLLFRGYQRLFLWRKRPELQAYHSPQSGSEVKNAWILLPLLSYVFHGVEHNKRRNDFTYAFIIYFVCHPSICYLQHTKYFGWSPCCNFSIYYRPKLIKATCFIKFENHKKDKCLLLTPQVSTAAMLVMLTEHTKTGMSPMFQRKRFNQCL